MLEPPTSSATLGPFELIDRLGEGGQGEVWRARHCRTGVPVAVKVLTAEGARRSLFQDAFRAEVQAVAALSHAHVIAVFDHGIAGPGGLVAENSPWLAMELASGDLSSLAAVG